MRFIHQTILYILLCTGFLISQTTVSEAEYFIDTDPGVGNGISLNSLDGLFNSQTEDISLSINTDNIGLGGHIIYLRFKDSDGVWGLPVGRTFTVSAPSTDITLEAAEYFIDYDPGEGNGISIPITTSRTYYHEYGSREDGNIDFEIDASELGLGAHTIYLRCLDSQGVWGSPVGRQLTITNPTNDNLITDAEYFIDTDPAEGNGIPLNSEDGSFNDLNESINLSINSLDVGLGAHTIYVRFKDSDNNWGNPIGQLITVSTPPEDALISEAEYFIDNDPGLGNGIPLDPVDGSYNSETEQVDFEINSNDLGLGSHVVYVRFRGYDGQWGPPTGKLLTVTDPQPPPSIVEAEYFFDNDPGEGNGISIDYQLMNETETIVNIDEEIYTTDLSLGEHRLYLRFKDSNEVWSQVSYSTFTVFEQQIYNIVEAEYFIDNDPGQGNGISIEPSDGSFNSQSEDISFDLNPDDIGLGSHMIYIRFKDENDLWGQPKGSLFTITNPNPTFDIVQAEYFIGNDPGEGNGVTVNPNDGDFDSSLEDIIFDIDTEEIGLGAHIVYVRFQDESENWGLPIGRTFTVSAPSTDITLEAAEYFIDYDPGEGNGISIPITTSRTYYHEYGSREDGNIDFEIDASELGLGAHTIYLRCLDSQGVWGSPSQTLVTVSADFAGLYIVDAELFFDVDPGEGNGISFQAQDGNLNQSVEELIYQGLIDEEFPEGAHTVYSRAKSSDNIWGQKTAQSFTFVKTPPLVEVDYFTTNEDELMEIEYPGVLENDQVYENNYFSVLMIDSTQFGQLTLDSTGSIEYIPNLNFNGVDSFTYITQFGDLTSDTTEVHIDIEAVNDPVTVENPISDIEVVEDQGTIIIADLDTVFYDIDTEFGDLSEIQTLTYSIESNSNPELLLVDINEDNIISINLNENQNGVSEITIKADDSIRRINYQNEDDISRIRNHREIRPISINDNNRSFVEDTFLITVYPQNDNPVLSEISDQSTNEDEDLIISIYASDIDIVTNEQSLSFDVISSDLDKVIAYIDDEGTLSSYQTDIDKRSIKTKTRNDFIKVNRKGLLIESDLTNSREDDEVIANLVMDVQDNQYGDVDITVTVSDDGGRLIDSQIFNLSILAINDFPVAVAGLDQNLIIDISNTSEVTINASESYDIDSDNLEFIWNLYDQDQELIISNEEISTLNLPPGVFNFSLTVIDDYELESTDSLVIYINDCEGELSGENLYDDCGVCSGFNVNIDVCGVCFGDNSTCTGCTDDTADNVDQCGDGNDECLIDDGSCLYTQNYTLHSQANLISFLSLPDDTSIDNVLPIEENPNIIGIVGEGVAASPHPILGWIGSTNEIDISKGYWIKMSESDDITIIANEPPGHTDVIYNLHFGANLISFPLNGSYNINDVLPQEVIWVTTGVIGEGLAASNVNGQFIGSLNELVGGKGYWFKVTDPIDFQFIIPEDRENIQNNKKSTSKKKH